MKRLFLSIATVALVVGFISCEKNIADDTSTVAKTYKVNFSVSDKPSFDNATRASKEGWTDGDQILVMFKPTSEWLLEANDNENTLTLTYNNGEWTTPNVSQDLMDKLAEGTEDVSYFYAVYYRGDVGIGDEDEGCYWFANYKGGEYYYDDGKYTITDNALTLTQITMDKGTDIFQISVNDLLSKTENQAKSWKLAILRSDNDILPIRGDHPSQDEYVDELYYTGMAEGYFTFEGKTTPKEVYYATAVNNDDDATFWFGHAFIHKTTEEVKVEEEGESYSNGYYFTLTNGEKTYYYHVVRDVANDKYLNPEEAYLLPAITEQDKWVERTHADVQWDRTEPIEPQPSGDE